MVAAGMMPSFPSFTSEHARHHTWYDTSSVDLLEMASIKCCLRKCCWNPKVPPDLHVLTSADNRLIIIIKRFPAQHVNFQSFPKVTHFNTGKILSFNQFLLTLPVNQNIGPRPAERYNWHAL